MERDNFNPYNFESSSESSEDDKKDDKKKAKSATGLGKLVAREEQEPKETPKTEEKDERSFLQKLAGEPAKAEVDNQQETDESLPLDELSADEQIEAAQAHIDARTQELASESNEAQAPEELAETEANEVFLEAIQEHLAKSGDEANIDEVVEAAFAEVAAELNAENSDEDAPDHIADHGNETAVDDNAEADEPQVFDPDRPVPVVTAHGSGSGGGTGGRGVSASAPPSAMPPASGGSARVFGTGAATRGHDVSPDRFSSADAAYYERRGTARGLLVGGVVGYLLGRRRGRIKTEKRLKTVQEKLEKQVESVQQTIEQQEMAIRKLAREKVVAFTATTRVERTTSASARSGEATRMSERGLPAKPEQSPSQKAEATKAAVDSLSKEELLAFSAQIRVGETSLRRVYEAQLVDEKGLRRLIKEYQAGHDLRRALAREFLVKELKFERDPTLRDLLPPEVQPRRQGKTEAGGNQYGDNGAAAAVNDIAAQIAAAGRSDRPVNPGAISSSHSLRTGKQTSVSSGVLIGMTLLTIGLAIYAIWLTLTR